MKERPIRKTIAGALAVLMITCSMFAGSASFGAAQSADPAAEATVADIQAGDTLELKSGDWSEDYIVLDPDNTNTGEEGMFLLQKDYGESQKTVFDESGLNNAWEGSVAQRWCTRYYNALPLNVRRSVIGVKTTESESGYDNAGINNIDGTRAGADSAKDKVFFLSSLEYLTYADSANITSTAKWWLRSPGIDCSEFHDYACVVMENGRILPFGVGYIEQGAEYLGQLARPAFNIDIPDETAAAKSSEGSETIWTVEMDTISYPSEQIKIGDHIRLGKEDETGYTGEPYWRVINKDEDGELYLLSEYLWLGNGEDPTKQIQFNSNSIKGNSWEGSDALEWCRSFENDILRGVGGIHLIGGVTFLSEDELSRFIPVNQDWVTTLPNGASDEVGRNWLLRTPKSESNTLVRVVIGAFGIISQTEVTTSNPARPAFRLKLSSGANLSKDENGDWVISEENEPGGGSGDQDGSEELPELDPSDMVAASEIETGDYIYVGDENTGGFAGLPYWRVLDEDSEGNLLLMSEYLWKNDSTINSGLFCFNADRSKENGWQGSDAQDWCRRFETAVLDGEEELTVKETTKSDAYFATPDKEGLSFREASNILNNDKVFFLSAEEAARYMPTKKDRIAYIPNGKKTKSESWWLRSARAEVGGQYCVGRVFSYGSLEKNFVDYLGAGRPAMWAKLSDDAMAYKYEDAYLLLDEGEDPRAELKLTKDAIEAKEQSGGNDGPSDAEKQEEAATAPSASSPQEVLDPSLPKVSIKAAGKSKKSFTAKWKKLNKKKRKKVQGIEVQYAGDKAFTQNVVLRTAKKGKTSLKIKKLQPKKTYWVRVRSYRNVNGVKHVSKWSKVKKAKTK